MEKELSLVSKYRSQLMGFAILWVVIYHFPFYKIPEAVSFVKYMGYGGVDIFFFLSGFGLYYSLKKNSNALLFYKKRILRLFPPYIPFIIVWYAARAYTFKRTFTTIFLRNFLGNIFMTGYIRGYDDQFNWYVQALLWFYLLTPLIYLLLKKNTSKIYLKITVLFSLLVLINIISFSGRSIVFVSRAFVFTLGLVLPCIADRIKSSKAILICSAFFIAAGYGFLAYGMLSFRDTMWSYGLYWYPFAFIAPSVCFIGAHIFDFFAKHSFGMLINRFLAFMGKHSFEVYLFHVGVFELLAHYVGPNKSFGFWAAVCVVTVCAGVIYSVIINKITDKLSSRKKLKEN